MKIIIDTDPGVDDAMALALAKAEPRLEVAALTTVFGNVSAATATRNALALTEWLDLPVPVAEGAAKPLVLPEFPPVDHVHGPEGFGAMPAPAPTRTKDPRSAAELIVAEADGAVLAPIGPFTNVARALEADPALPQRLDRIVVMGGGLARGNVTPHAEANVWHDPHAARAVLRSGGDVWMVGLDVTDRILCTRDDFAAMEAASPGAGGLLWRMGAFYLDFYASKGMAGCGLHDPAALIAVTDPDLFDWEETGLDVICEGDEIGRTVRADGPPVKVAVGGDLEAVKSRFLERVSSLP